MAVRPYDSTDAASVGQPYPETGGRDAGYAATTTGNVGGKAFLWFAWAIAAAFWGFMLTTGAGILRAADNPALRAGGGGAGAGGLGFLMMDVIGVVVLGLALAWGSWRWASRDKARDGLTESATRTQYDLVEAAGGDDDVRRSPEARRPEERDSATGLDTRPDRA